MAPVSIGTVVRDRFGREGIVCSIEAKPSADWIKDQVGHEEIERLPPDTRWFGVMPFEGGYLRCPENELTWLRPAAYEDFLAVADEANPAGRERLVRTFPNFVNRLLAERGPSQ